MKKEFKFYKPGWVKVYNPQMTTAVKIPIEKGKTVRISDEPYPTSENENRLDQGHEEKQKPQLAEIPGYVWVLIALLILFAGLFFGNITKSEPEQELPKSLPNHYELPQSY